MGTSGHPTTRKACCVALLGSNHDLVPLYNKWFIARMPTGERMNVPISLQLEEAFKAMDDSASANN